MERLSIISAKPAQTRGILSTIINQLEEKVDGNSQRNAGF
jgi:hypothetical protein